MDEGLRRSAWITLCLAVAAYALLNHPLQSILVAAIFAGIWMLRGRSSGPLSASLRDLPGSVPGAVFDRRDSAARAARPAARPMPAGDDTCGAPPSDDRSGERDRSAEELSGMLRDLCRSEGEAKREDNARRSGRAPSVAFPPRRQGNGPRPSPAPDYAGAVIGYREWLFVPRLESASEFAAAPAALYSLTRQQVAPARGAGGPDRPRFQEWPLGTAHESRCGRIGTNPAPGGECADFGGCACGFYAWYEVGRLGAAGRPGYTKEACHLVPGVIAGWGRVSLHEGGFRCQKAKVVALLGPAEISFAGTADPGAAREAYADLVRRSGALTLSWRELRDPLLARRLELLDPRELAIGERG